MTNLLMPSERHLPRRKGQKSHTPGPQVMLKGPQQPRLVSNMLINIMTKHNVKHP